jgi:hypothetical protein
VTVEYKFDWTRNFNIISFFTDCRNAFGFICKNNLIDTRGMSSKLYSFMVDSDETTKKDFITSLGKSIVNMSCVSDYVCSKIFIKFLDTCIYFKNLLVNIEGMNFPKATRRTVLIVLVTLE